MSEREPGSSGSAAFSCCSASGATACVPVEVGEKTFPVSIQRIEFDSTKHFLESGFGFALNTEENAVPFARCRTPTTKFTHAPPGAPPCQPASTIEMHRKAEKIEEIA